MDYKSDRRWYIHLVGNIQRWVHLYGEYDWTYDRVRANVLKDDGDYVKELYTELDRQYMPYDVHVDLVVVEGLRDAMEEYIERLEDGVKDCGVYHRAKDPKSHEFIKAMRGLDIASDYI